MESIVFTLRQIAEWTSGDKEVTLPALQRGLVWKPNQVELLWDSILRGFPIGSFLLADVSDEKGKKYYLMDGHQRYNAISIGYNTVKDARAVLWIDIAPPIIDNSTRHFWVKATTVPHPWGFNNDDESSIFSTDDRRKALGEFGLQGSIYNEPFSLESTWPYKARCPIPLYCFIVAAEKSNDADSFFKNAMSQFQSSSFAYKEKAKITEGAVEYVKQTLYPAFSILRDYRITCNHLPKALIASETDKETVEQTTLEVLFTRLNTGGTRISRDDLNYSAIKSYWPTIKDSNDCLAEKYMAPSKLVMLAFRLALTDEYLQNEISIKQIRSYAKDREKQETIERLYNEGNLEKILLKIDDWLGVSNTDELRTPRILRTLIATNSPDVYLLLMYLACKDLQSPIILSSDDIRSLAFGLHWLSNDKLKCARKIFEYCKKGINRENIQRGLFELMYEGYFLPVCSPKEVEEFMEINNCVWSEVYKVPVAAQDFFNRVFWNNRQSQEMLLFAERKYLNSHFKNYDPSKQDLWADYNRPWDFDHIIPRNIIDRKRGAHLSFDKMWLVSIGNMAAISYEANRSKNDGRNYNEYNSNAEPLLFDDSVEQLCYHDITYDSSKSQRFAQVTYCRFCKIYSSAYDIFGSLFKQTVLPEYLQLRRDCMTELYEHYKDKGAIVHFVANNDEDCNLDREQDWTRKWMGVGIVRNAYMVCFEWTGETNHDGSPKNAEVGIRKAPGTQISEDNDNLSLGKVNYWWYEIEWCNNNSIEYLTERMDYYLSKVEQIV